MQQLKGRAMNRIKVSKFFISVQLAKWDSLSYNYTFYVCSSGGQQYIEVACLGQRSSVGACKTTGCVSESRIDNKAWSPWAVLVADVGAVIRVWCGCCELLLEAASDAAVQVPSELSVQLELLGILVWGFSAFRFAPSKALYFRLFSCFNTREVVLGFFVVEKFNFVLHT